MVLRAPYGGGVRALEHHSESREAYYAHTPGLKMVMPSGPRNARALLVSAIRDPDPVIFFEPKATFEEINRRPSFWLPFLLCILISFLAKRVRWQLHRPKNRQSLLGGNTVTR